jgi:hypothetical protein
MKGEVIQQGRNNHSISYFKNQLIIFGGEDPDNSSSKERICINDLRSINLDDQYKVSQIKTNGDFIYPRRNHAHLVLGRHLIIHGGINSKGNYLNDLWIYDIIV